MNFKGLVVNLVKLLTGSIAFYAGLIAGGMLAAVLQLQPPAMPAGVDAAAAVSALMLSSPFMALALALLARGLGGSFVTRALALSFLTWIAYGVNTQLEAAVVSTFATGIAFTLVSLAVASLCCGATVAFLFPADDWTGHAGEMLRDFLARRSAGAWAWRLAIAAVAFMPIYWLFGSLVIPFTGEYYRQQMYGLQMPTLDRLLPVLFARSVLFLVACLPVVALWQKSNRALFLSLGFALYVLVGLLTLFADWMPLAVRVPHTLEILADEFVYAGVLVALLRAAGMPVRAGVSGSPPHHKGLRQGWLRM